jgi:hypothetical protein
MMKTITVIALLLSACGSSSAACYQANSLVPPSKDVKVYFGETPEGFASFGDSPYGQTSIAYSPSPPPGIMEQSALQIAPDRTSIKLWYFESSNKSKAHRICRVDSWVPRKVLSQTQLFIDEIRRNVSGNSLPESLLKRELTLAYSTTYSYDSKGRIERVDQTDFTKGPAVESKALHCRRYDEKDRVVLWVNPQFTKKCPQGEPSVKDEWREFRFDNVGGKEVELRRRWHSPKGEDEWREEWAPFQVKATPDSARGHAYVDSRRGVKEIFGSNYGKRDNNAANMVVDVFERWQGSTYYFPKPPVPLSVLENPDEIYKYERRRMTRLDSQTRMFELFKPNEHVSRHRIYMFAGRVLRHDQVDANGKVKRIITVNDWRQPRPGPNPDFDDRLLTTSAPRLSAHQVYHRVYEVDGNGHPTLVALSWHRSARSPLKKAPISAADLVFGTPDGKVRWRTREEFDSAFDTSEDARQVFPDSSKDVEDL